MFGIVYIVLSFLTGKEAAGFLLEAGENREKRGNQIWLLISASLESEPYCLPGVCMWYRGFFAYVCTVKSHFFMEILQ